MEQRPVIRLFRQWLACKRLERLVIKQREHNRNYSKHRAAGKKGWAMRRSAAALSPFGLSRFASQAKPTVPIAGEVE